MIILGKTQELKLHKATDFGVYLCDPTAKKESPEDIDQHTILSVDSILLPKAQVPSEAKNGDLINVFVYKDSKDRPIATTTIPPMELGTIAKLKVKEVSQIGAFLDWGLAKDLLLPFKEQVWHVAAGEEILVSLYIDKSQRLCATMRVYPYLSTESPYQKGDWVDGIVYERIDSFGAFVAIDDKYSALIPNKALHKPIAPGTPVHARIANRLEDGKLELTLSNLISVQMTDDKELIFAALEKAGGFLPLHDKSQPSDIEEAFGLSKNAFKRAIGRLMKEERITIEPEGIRIR